MPELFNSLTNTQGLLVFGGERSDTYGMVVSEAPSFERPARKQTIFNVPGRNGAVLFQEDAWEDVPRSYKVFLAATSAKRLDELVDAAEAWLNSKKGYQELTDNFEPDIFRLAYFTGADFSNVRTQYGEAAINFTCRPERFLLTGKTAVTVSNGSTMSNATKFTAKPLIHIEGNGTFTVAAGGKTITATCTDYINIDCETENAYRLASENKNGDISGAFPLLPPGTNTIAITGAPTLVQITPRYFTI